MLKLLFRKMSMATISKKGKASKEKRQKEPKKQKG